MSLLDLLGDQLGGDTVRQISTEIGADEETTQNAMSAALPVLLGAMAKNASSTQGAEGLHHAISRDHDGGVLDNVSSLLGGGGSSAGAGILGHLLGSRERQVETGLSKSTGLNSDASAKLLQLLAPLVMGAVGRQQRQQNLDAGGLSDLLGGERQRLEQEAPEQMSMIGKMLDTDGDGDFDMSDMLKHGSRVLGSFFRK